MTLRQFLSTLQSETAMITVVDLDTNSELVNFKVSGYESLDDSIESMLVKQWSITSSASIKVMVGTA